MNTNTLGIIIPHMGSSQISYEAINLASKMNNAVIFFEQLVAPCVPVQCSTMCITEVMTFSGLLVTTTIENTIMAAKISNRKKLKLVFYVWDLEWLRPGKNNYLHNIAAYNLADVLVVRNQDHVAPLLNYCNRQPLVKEFQQVITC